jgi:hypothetical protein
MPPDPPGDGLDATRELAAWIRDPERAPAPAGIEPLRLKAYADLFFNNLEGLLAGAFPVLRSTLGDTAWEALVRDFLREHPARTPLFTGIADELLVYLDARAAQGRGDPPWVPELAHYEWVELALQLDDADVAGIPHDRAGDLLAGVPVRSPLAWPLAYAWPVHRIGPSAVPEIPTTPTLLLLRRRQDGTIGFNELSPLTFRLLQRIDELPEATGIEHLRALADEAAARDVDAFLVQGATTLESLRRDGTLLGARSTTP